MNSRIRTRQSAGFSLIQLAIAIVVIGLLAAVAMRGFGTYSKKSRAVEADLRLGKISQVLNQIYQGRKFPMRSSFVPVTSVLSMISASDLKGKYFKASDYTYQCKDGKSYTVRATGKGDYRGINRQINQSGILSDFTP